MTRTTTRHHPKAKKASDVSGRTQTRPKPAAVKTVTKTADSKGRVVLGGQFANRAVIIETMNETEVIVKLARVIPESEAWLYQNPEALAAVRTGLSQARAGKVARGPDVDADARFAAELEG